MEKIVKIGDKVGTFISGGIIRKNNRMIVGKVVNVESGMIRIQYRLKSDRLFSINRTIENIITKHELTDCAEKSKQLNLFS